MVLSFLSVLALIFLHSEVVYWSYWSFVFHPCLFEPQNYIS
jgi:hypothetical protein